MKDNNLELGKYLESDLLEITEDEVEGGYTPVLASISIWISDQTCPSTACTRAC
ncbi:class II lanthipeptide, LchA2/BrtA2 family [Priestia megaterium]|uniref:class II lanthipeptide, LchA2/BrtA2 family n=1 Tax=Priestia megaterium TaxID=1404 RepID=UPI001642460A|nr:class II lanthipeptide, LchA2/BrtA2 family [Priestia megaterium]